MKQMSDVANEGLDNQILDFCRHVSGSADITAVAHVDNYSMKTISEKTIVNILLVIHGFQPRIMSYIKTLDDRTIFVFAVDQWVFERDIEIGLLGEAMASKLVFPYTALSGEAYLHKKEVALKKRLILELLENLAQSFPELTSRMQLKPQYFFYEALLDRIRIFPLLNYDVSNLSNVLNLHEASFMVSYNEALRELEAEGKIFFLDNYVKISSSFLAQCHDPKIKIINFSKNAPRTIFTSFFGAFPQLISIFSQNTEASEGSKG